MRAEMNDKKEDEIYCPECGKAIKKNFNVCPYCGVKIKNNEVPDQTTNKTEEVSKALSGIGCSIMKIILCLAFIGFVIFIVYLFWAS